MDSKASTKKIAIITGASAGLGSEFAIQIEKSFYVDEIWLVARRAAPMKEISQRFQKSKSVVLALDLTNEGDLQVLKHKIESEKPIISILVNNAGYGKLGPFAELGLDEQLKMIDLNIRSLTFLTHISIPFMEAGSKIIQVASSAGFAPSPFFAIYAATKAFVVNFSEALNYELREAGIQVLAVCPGPVATEFFSVAQRNEFMKDKVGNAEHFGSFLTAEAFDVVELALHDLRKKKSRSVYGWPIKFFVFATRFTPRFLVLKAFAKRNRT